MAKRVQFSDLPVVEYQAGDTIAAYRNGQVVRIPVGGGGGEMPDLAAVATTGQYNDLLGKPTLGSAASMSASAFATAAQGAMAATALQPADIGVTIQAYSAILSGTTASFTAALKTKLDGIATGATANATDAALRDRSTHTGTQAISTIAGLDAALGGKVDKEAGKGLSTEDYSTAEKSKLAGVEAGATANATDAQLRDRATHTGTQAANTITGLAAVATSGAYGDLSGRPTIPAAQVPSDWNATTGPARILNKPTLGTAAAANASDFATAAQGVNADTAYGWGNHASAGYALASSLATVATSGSYSDLSNKPTIPTLPATVSQAEAEGGSATTARLWTSQRVRQAVAAYSYSKSEVEGLIAGGGVTASEIKTLYESNANTNAFTDADKSKLTAVGTNANRDATISTASPSGGNNGDIWYQVD